MLPLTHLHIIAIHEFFIDLPSLNDMGFSKACGLPKGPKVCWFIMIHHHIPRLFLCEQGPFWIHVQLQEEDPSKSSSWSNLFPVEIAIYTPFIRKNQPRHPPTNCSKATAVRVSNTSHRLLGSVPRQGGIAWACLAQSDSLKGLWGTPRCGCYVIHTYTYIYIFVYSTYIYVMYIYIHIYIYIIFSIHCIL